MPLPYTPTQAYDQELADAFRVRYPLADQRSIQRLRSIAGHPSSTSYASSYGNMAHDTYAQPPLPVSNTAGADIMCDPQYHSLPSPAHSDFVSRSHYYPPIPPGTQPYPFVTSHLGVPLGSPIGYGRTWVPMVCLAWQPAGPFSTLHSPPPFHPPTSPGNIPGSPSSTSQSSAPCSEASNTSEPEPLLTAEEFVQTLHRLELDGRRGQAPIAQFRLQGEPAHVSVSRPRRDGPFVIKHYDADGREDGISVAHILPAQGGIMWCPPPRINYSLHGSNERGV